MTNMKPRTELVYDTCKHCGKHTDVVEFSDGYCCGDCFHEILMTLKAEDMKDE